MSADTPSLPAPLDDEASRYNPAVDPEASRYDPATVDDQRTNYVAEASPSANQTGSWPQTSGGGELPRRFGQYELLEEIARGGMGVVYRARQLGPNGQTLRPVALKMILAGAEASREVIQRFWTEAQTASALNHPNVVRIFEVGENEGRPFFSMELVEGGNLADLVRNGPLPPREAARIVEQLAEGVQAVHEQGVIHRDIKPQNVLLGDPAVGTRSPKITDFGLARTRDGGSSITGDKLGTPSYMAPEQAAGKVRETSAATDVYGLGAVLYCLLTGRPPFSSSSQLETMRLVLSEEPVPPRQLNPAVPRDLETVCLKCLEKAAGQRYQMARELAEELARYRRGELVKAQPVGPLERGWRWSLKNPLAAVVVGLAGLGLIVFTLLWMTRPAYLDLTVNPINAQVTFGGRPIELTAGRGLIAHSAGHHELVVSAEGYEPLTQSLALIRGRDNAASLNVQLRSLFGRVQLDSLPSRAMVEVLDGDSTLIHRGSTPYHSPRFRSGLYTIRLIKDLHALSIIEVSVPSGEQVIDVPTVALKPLEGASKSTSLLALWKAMNEDLLVGEWPEIPQNPNLKLRDVLTSLTKKVAESKQLPGFFIECDRKAFMAEQMDAPEDVSLVRETSLPGLAKSSLGGYLDLVLQRVPIPSGARWWPVKRGGVYGITITTSSRSYDHFHSFFFPVEELLEKPIRLQSKDLLRMVNERVLLMLPEVREMFLEVRWRTAAALGLMSSPQSCLLTTITRASLSERWAWKPCLFPPVIADPTWLEDVQAEILSDGRTLQVTGPWPFQAGVDHLLSELRVLPRKQIIPRHRP